MTHKDIYTKFMIEYDKANITSSYPSLTKYEIATLLDKAYLASIAQKITGNNTRKSTFESDIKSIEDLRQLVTTESINDTVDTNDTAINELTFSIPSTFLYYVSSSISFKTTAEKTTVDTYAHNKSTVQLLNHIAAQSFKATSTNMPWVKSPVAYIENTEIHVLVDPYKYKNGTTGTLSLTYIKQPGKFVKDTESEMFTEDINFELSDTVAEELINLAIIMALETVESSRLSTKIQTSTYES